MGAKAVKLNTAATKNRIDFKSIIFGVLAIVFVCYANSLTNSYNMDDEIVTINHPLTSKGLSAIPDILKSPYFQSDIYAYEYRPVVHISFAIEHQFLGESPFVSHLINLLLYLLLIYVAFDLLKRLFPAVNQTIIAAIILVFALHPTHTEVVASIKNRDEILALLFSLLSWREAIKFVTTKQWWRILLVLLLFNLAMGSKVTMVIMAILIPITLTILFEFNFFKGLLLALLLSGFGVLWIQSFSLQLQMTVVLGNLFLYAVSYPLVKGIFTVTAFKAFIKSLIPQLGKSESALEEDVSFLDINTLKNFWASNFRFLSLLFVINIVFVIYGITAWHLFSLISLVAVVLFFADKSSKHIWAIVLFFFTIEYLLLFEEKSVSSSATSFIFLLIGSFLSRKVVSKWILGTMMVIAALIAFKLQDKFAFFLLLNFLSIRRVKFIWGFTVIYALFLFLAVKNYLISGKFQELNFIRDALLIFLFNASFLVRPAIKKHTEVLLSILLLIGISSSLLVYVFDTKKGYNEDIKKVVELPNDVSVTITPSHMYRPVLFAEFPVDVYKDPLGIRIGTSAQVLLKYMRLLAIPYPLSFYYGYAEIEPTKLWSPVAIFSIVLNLLLLGAMVFLFKRNTFISFGILVYLLSIAPFSSFFAPIPGVMADRYLFLPTLGFAMALVGVITWLTKLDWTSKLSGVGAFPKNAKYALGGLLLIYASLTIARNNDWKDRLTLFRNDIVNVPNSAQAHNLLAFHLNRTAQEVTDPFERKKLMEEAATHFQRATEIWPEFMNASYDLGRTHEQLGNWNEAIAAYKRTFEIDTSFSDAIFRMGIVYEADNRLDSAIIAYQFVTEDNPVNITAFNNLSYCYFKKQEYRNAIETGRRSSFHHPANTDPIVNIGKTFLHIKENDSALYYFEKVYPNRADDRGLTEVLYKLWNEKGNTERAAFYYRRMQIMGMVK